MIEPVPMASVICATASICLLPQTIKPFFTTTHEETRSYMEIAISRVWWTLSPPLP